MQHGGSEPNPDAPTTPNPLKTLRAVGLPVARLTNSGSCAAIQHDIKNYAQTIAMKRDEFFVDIEFETHEHANYVLKNFSASHYQLSWAPDNIICCGVKKPGEVTFRPPRRDLENNSIERSLPLPRNNPNFTEWYNNADGTQQSEPIFPAVVHQSGASPLPPFVREPPACPRTHSGLP